MRPGLFAKLGVYLFLAVAVLLTVAPLAYLVTGAFKTREVFFEGGLLPKSSLLRIEQGSGRLLVSDDSLLPDSGPAVVDITVVVIARGQLSEPEPRLLRVEIDAEDESTTITGVDGEPVKAADLFQALGPFSGTVQFRITEGNPSAPLGVAWNQLTLEQFDRLTDRSNPRAIKPTITVFLTNSLVYAGLTAIGASGVCVCAGYALAKLRFRGRNIVNALVLAMLIVPAALFIAPLYKVIHMAGLMDTLVGLVLPGLAPAFGVLLYRQAISAGVPDELIEAARLDGCSEPRIVWSITLPLVRSVTGAFMLLVYLGAWNNYIWPQLVVLTPDRLPLAVGVAQLRDVYSVDYGLMMAATLIAVVPVAVLFLVLQRDFVKEIMSSAIR